MVIVQLAGGLGNQMFQYAIAYSLAKRAGVGMKIDLSYFENYEWHCYCLDVLNITSDIAKPSEIINVKQCPNNLFERLSRYIFGNRTNNIYKEVTLLFNQKFNKAKKNIYLQGYFQCEKYFNEYKDFIRKEFEILKVPSISNKALILDINSNTNTVSLHIRRGNYVHNPSVNKVHGVLNIEYYNDAIRYLEARLGTLKVYIFSDDISWAKANLKFKQSSFYVDLNDENTNYEDLRLMSLCKHNVIANSSFSWWGAWLNQNPNKIVVAPKQWFADPIKNEEAKDIVPESWIKL
jgi:hypothetical protein